MFIHKWGKCCKFEFTTDGKKTGRWARNATVWERWMIWIQREWSGMMCARGWFDKQVYKTTQDYCRRSKCTEMQISCSQNNCVINMTFAVVHTLCVYWFTVTSFRVYVFSWAEWVWWRMMSSDNKTTTKDKQYMRRKGFWGDDGWSKWHNGRKTWPRVGVKSLEMKKSRMREVTFSVVEVIEAGGWFNGN